ncbi:deleted in lung and esophageal cancer protein 1-like [Prionailurus viverrinus]|uniref:deleted in lung and esophageal cancer protein 1-like n=1 Tax=Prionailurus viverrinus TaxID=61388 RepID=UPI001FF6526C|nr:deleted in lung and esophageal cancer protein 1-like [Prionailurus viverrinus]
MPVVNTQASSPGRSGIQDPDLRALPKPGAGTLPEDAPQGALDPVPCEDLSFTFSSKWLLVLTGAGRRAGCSVRGPNTPDTGAGWREAPCRPHPGHGGRGRKEDRSPGGEAAARLRQREATALLTSAQVNVSFSLSLELLSYQKLPADQMLPGVDVRRHANGEKEMVFAQNLLLEYADQPAQVVPLKATVAVPELQLSTSWVDFGTCFVNQARVREVYLMNLSGWAELKSISACPS